METILWTLAGMRWSPALFLVAPALLLLAGAVLAVILLVRDRRPRHRQGEAGAEGAASITRNEGRER